MSTENTHEEEAPVEIQIAVETVEEVVPAVVADAVEVVEAPAVVEVAKPAAVVEDRSAVVSGADKDEVLLAACIYKNPRARKSLSIHHLQRRLAALGYAEAYADKDGWYGDLTKNAVTAFQTDNGLEVTGLADAETLHAIFDGDGNVTVVA